MVLVEEARGFREGERAPVVVVVVVVTSIKLPPIPPISSREAHISTAATSPPR